MFGGVNQNLILRWAFLTVVVCSASCFDFASSGTAKPILTAVADDTFPDHELAIGQTLSVDFNNIQPGSPGNDLGMTYACAFDQTIDGEVSPGNDCTQLPGQASFQIATGILQWTPDATAWGAFEIQVTGTNAAGTATQIFVVDVRQPYSVQNLLGDWDAQFATQVGPASGSNAVWKDLTSHKLDGSVGSGTTWTGTGSSNSPYALSFNGTASGLVDFDGTIPLNGVTQLMFTAWINPATPSAGDAVLFGNSADGTGAGFTVRQSKSHPSKMEFVIGTSYQDAVLADAPIAYWRLNDPANSQTALDISGGGHPATYTNSTPGQIGAMPNDSSTSTTFNGHGYVAGPTWANVKSNFTMELWVLPTVVRTSTAQATSGISGTSGQSYAIFPDHSGGTNLGTDCGAGISVGTNGISVFCHTDNNLFSPVVYDTTVTSWTHVAVVFNANVPTLYVNGTPVAPGVTPNFTPHPSSGAIGAGSAFSGYGPFSGLVQDYAVYDTALTPVQIANHYQAAAGGYGALCISNSSFTSEWSFISGLYDGTVATLFLNGVSDCAIPASVDITGAATGFFAGATASGTSPWAGQIADLKLYGTSNGSSVGNANVITTNFNATSPQFGF